MAADESNRTSELAASLSNLSGVLTSVGRYQDALDAVEEAVRHYRALGQRDELAGALSNLSGILAALGRHSEALAAAEESVETYRGTAAGSIGRHGGELAGALSNLSGILAALGRHSEALAAAEESVLLTREGAGSDPDRHLAELASGLNNLSNRLAAVGRAVEALEAIEEAVGTYRRLAEQQSDRFLPELAKSLGNLSIRLAGVQRPEEALEAIEEAVHAYRALAEREPERHQPDLASALSDLSVSLAQVGRQDEALTTIEDSIRLYRGLAERQPDRYLPDLANVLNNLSINLAQLERLEEAVEASRQAVQILQELAVRQPDRSSAPFGVALANLSRQLGAAGREEESLTAASAAVGVYRGLAEREPERHLPDLAGLLNNLAIALAQTGRDKDAVGAIEEAVGVYRELAEQQPERYLPDLAKSLGNLSTALTATGRGEEALAAVEGALADYEGEAGAGALLIARARSLFDGGDRSAAITSSLEALDALGDDNRSLASQIRLFLHSMRERDADGFDETWGREIGRERPPWLRYPAPDPALIERLVEWLQTPTWEASRKFLEANSDELLSEQALAALQYFADVRSDQPELLRHVEILDAARRSGIDDVFSAILDSVTARTRQERLRSWISLDFDGSLEFLRRNRGDLLNHQVAAELQALALENPEDATLIAWLGLLELSISEGPVAAYKHAKRVGGMPADFRPEAKDPDQLLNLARLQAGLNERSAEPQFRHAVGAAAMGQAEEARQAIERCRLLLPSWELPQYAERLDALIATDSGSGAELERLKRGFAEASLDPPA
jgi:tetratricopeptide (TPR) repeat protein